MNNSLKFSLKRYYIEDFDKLIRFFDFDKLIMTLNA